MEIKKIGTIHSPFKQKFGIPRQSGLVRSSLCTLVMEKEFNDPNWYRGLEDMSSLWITFAFHKNADRPKNPTIRPPRLGGDRRIGTFASRSPDRPNNLGLSLVELESVNVDGPNVQLTLKGGDFLDGTPVYDIRPFHPQADVPTSSNHGWIDELDEKDLTVSFDQADLPSTLENSELDIIRDLLKRDPRPAWKGDTDDKVYKMIYHPWEVAWSVTDSNVIVQSLRYASTFPDFSILLLIFPSVFLL